MGIEIGNEDSVFREVIETHLNHVDQKIATVASEMRLNWRQKARCSIEIAKIHLYVAKVLLNNWNETEGDFDPHNLANAHPDFRKKI